MTNRKRGQRGADKVKRTRAKGAYKVEIKQNYSVRLLPSKHSRLVKAYGSLTKAVESIDI